ncbi:hypothetical protein HW132_36110 [Brasilonema sp. CT11]|nr:hypothetical protein [Brasilonema sp. CT11]
MVAKAQAMCDNDFAGDEDDEEACDYNDMDDEDVAEKPKASVDRKRKFDEISTSRGKGGKGLGMGKPVNTIGKGSVVAKPSTSAGKGKTAPAAKKEKLSKSTKHVDKKGKFSAQSY